MSDVVAENRLSPAQASCIAGALSVEEYEAGLLGAGFADVSV